MMIEIEKGVPLSPKRGFEGVYPFPRMDVGDSFLVTVAPDEVAYKVRNRIASAAHAWGRAHDAKFATRIIQAGVRVWRVE